MQYLIENEKRGNAIVRQMVLDGLVVRLAGGVRTLPNEAIADTRNLINLLKTQNAVKPDQHETDDLLQCKAKYFHPRIAFNFDLAVLTEKLCIGVLPVATVLEKVLPNEMLCVELQYFLRGLLLIEDDDFMSADEWLQIWQRLLKTARKYGDTSTDLMYFVLYHLAKEIDGKRQLELLRALTTFATVKVSDFGLHTRHFQECSQ